jgi:hypothetical protein
MEALYASKECLLSTLVGDVHELIRGYTWEEQWALLFQNRAAREGYILQEVVHAPVSVWKFSSAKGYRMRTCRGSSSTIQNGIGGYTLSTIDIDEEQQVSARLSILPPRGSERTLTVPKYLTGRHVFGDDAEYISTADDLWTLENGSYKKIYTFSAIGLVTDIFDDCALIFHFGQSDMTKVALGSREETVVKQPSRITAMRGFLIDPNVTLFVTTHSSFLVDARGGMREFPSPGMCAKRNGTSLLMYDHPFTKPLKAWEFDPRVGWASLFTIRNVPESFQDIAVYRGPLPSD